MAFQSNYTNIMNKIYIYIYIYIYIKYKTLTNKTIKVNIHKILTISVTWPPILSIRKTKVIT